MALGWFVEAGDEGAFEEGVAEVADEDGGGEADEGDDEDGILADGEKAGGEAGDELKD